MKKHWWIIRAWFWYGYYTGFEPWAYDRAEALYNTVGSMAPRHAVEYDLFD